MKIAVLKPYAAPVVKKQACNACGTFAPECLVPVGELAMPMCWLCAHHVVEHDCLLADAFSAECDCMPHDIYPGRLFDAPAAPVAAEPEPVGVRAAERAALLDGPRDKLAAWAGEAHKQMSARRHAALKRRLS